MKVIFTGIHPEKQYYRTGVEKNHLVDRIEMILDIFQDGIDLTSFKPYLKMATSDLGTANKTSNLAVTADLKAKKLKIEYVVQREITSLKQVDFQLQFENYNAPDITIWQTAPFNITFYPSVHADEAIEYLYPEILSEHGSRISALEEKDYDFAESKLDKQETVSDKTFVYGFDKEGQKNIELTAASIPLDTSEFEDNLSVEDDTVQKAFNKLDKAIKSIDSVDILSLFNRGG